MDDGDWYIADAEIERVVDRAHRLAARHERLWPDDRAGAIGALRALLGSVGRGTVVRPPIRVDLGYNLHLGDDCFVNFGLVALDVAPIRVGNQVQIGPGVQLLTPVHPTDPGPRRAGWESARPITIGDGVWLGGGVIVCPGVQIGADTVVGAGAVVVRDLPQGVVAVGNPARIVRSL